MGWHYPGGLTKKSGAPRFLTQYLITSSRPKFCGPSGVDSASQDGTYQQPYLTMQYACAQASTYSIIMVQDGAGASEYVATVTVPQTGQTIVGEKVTSGLPSSTVGVTAAVVTLETWDNGLVRNLGFGLSQSSSVDTNLSTGAFAIIDCRFSQDENSARAVDINSTQACFYAKGCRFENSVSVDGFGPDGMRLNGALEPYVVEQCVFDDGVAGRDGDALDLGDASGNVYACSLLNGAGVNASFSSGIMYSSEANNEGGFDPAGFGATVYSSISQGTGTDDLMLARNILVSGNVVYVNSVTGDNTNTGQIGNPWATLDYARLNVSDNSIIVLQDGHTETLSDSADIVNSGVVIVADGDVTITVEGNSTARLNLSTGTEVRGITFEVVKGANGVRLSSASVGARVIGCTFNIRPSGSDATGIFCNTGSVGVHIEGCAFNCYEQTGVDPVDFAFAIDAFNSNQVFVKDVTVTSIGSVSSTKQHMRFASCLGLRAENIQLSGGATALADASSEGYVSYDADSSSIVTAF